MTRDQVLADQSIGGRELCRALASATDDWLAELHAAAHAAHPSAPPTALIAVGGYGRGELAPFSDLDVTLVHDGKSDLVAPVASAIWYPIWDAGLKLGHAVRRLDEQKKLAASDLDTATAMLTARQIAGSPELGARAVALGHEAWRKRSDRWLAELRDRVAARQADAGDVAYLLEPDLKDGHGGLRDVQSLWWASEAGLVVADDDLDAADDCYATLLGIRVALHRAAGRPGEVLRLELQDDVARAMAYADADALMADVAAAARRIMWIADESWGRVGRRITGVRRPVAPGVALVDGEIELEPDVDPPADSTLVLQTAVAAARHRCRIGRASLDRLAAESPGWPGDWPAGASDELVALLLEGHAAIPVLEALDQRGLVSRLLPEWEPCRSRPQRNAYHRYTVDRHLWEVAANAAELADRVTRPDLLVLGGLLHDIGKGYPGDHTEVGIELVRTIGTKLRLPAPDVDVLVALVEHHLLLPDVALRRDLADDRTIELVAEAVGSVEVLDLLHALTEADSKGTGPSAWGPWKENLVAELVSRTRAFLGGGSVPPSTWRLFPDADTLAAMAAQRETVTISGDRITVVTRDRPGSFSRIAGVLSLHGLDVLGATAHSDDVLPGRVGMAASQFRVEVPEGGIPVARLEPDLERAVRGALAIEARLAERASTYRRRRAVQAQPPAPPRVEFLEGASSHATVLEVRCPTKIGVLHRITKALADCGLDIRHASVQTLGLEVVDTFYVRTWAGDLVVDPAHRAEIERAVLHAVK
jgi:[protein-PII] uridylyltransferase